MADLRFDAEFLLSKLLPGVPGVEIVGARCAADRNCVILEIEGSGVPKDCREVTPMVTFGENTIELHPLPDLVDA